MKNPHDVILRPVLTEASYEGIADKRYVFEVHKSANKTEIKLALEAIFKDIKVEKSSEFNSQFFCFNTPFSHL